MPRLGYFPVTTAADEEQTFKDNVAQDPQFQTAIDQLHDSKPQYAGALLCLPEARQIVETEIDNMINGNETAGESSRINGFPDQQLHRGL